MKTVNEGNGKERVCLNSSASMSEIPSLIENRKEIEIDCGVMDISGRRLNEMMKIARAGGVEHFILKNVCGQNLIGTGIAGPAKITVYGIMGNHSCAFSDRLTINTFPTNFPNGVRCPGDAQVAIGTSANPIELNVAGSVDDLFASYAPSGEFRVAGQGGNRCVLRAGAGIPAVWREIDYTAFKDMKDNEISEWMLDKYQKRRAKIRQVGWDKYIESFKKDVERRTPPIVVFGRRVKDYFMEYAQGTVGIVLNVYDLETPIGYYTCSGMTAGRAYIRGHVEDARLGKRVKKGSLTDEDRKLLISQMKEFYACFNGVLHSERYQGNLDTLMEGCVKDPEKFTSKFVKIIPE